MIPYAVIAGAAGAIFGYYYGFLLAYLGALNGAVALFGLARLFSKERLVNHIIEKYEFDLRDVDERRLFLLLLTARLIPVIPTFIINIGSAVAGVPFRIFFLSSMLGKIFWALVYVGLGHYLISSGNWEAVAVILAVLLSIVLLGSRYYSGRIRFRSREPKKRIDNF